MKNNHKYTKEILLEVVSKSKSVREVLRRLGLALAGGNHYHISKKIKEYQIDVSHFLGQSWNKGKTYSITDIKDIFKKGYSSRPSSKRLTKAMTQQGVIYKCIKCPITNTYNNLPIVLEIDHINGDWTDNTFENLQFICPNCHSQKTKSDGTSAKARISISKRVSIINEIPNNPLACKISNATESEIKKRKEKQFKIPNPNWRHEPRTQRRKVEWPTKEELEKLVWQKPTMHIAKIYGVSDNAIAKWCKKYGISKPPRGYWNKLKFGKLVKVAEVESA